MFYKFMYIEVYTMFILRQLSQFCQVDFKWDELKHPVINLRGIFWLIFKARNYVFALKVSNSWCCYVGICLSNPCLPQFKQFWLKFEYF